MPRATIGDLAGRFQSLRLTAVRCLFVIYIPVSNAAFTLRLSRAESQSADDDTAPSQPAADGTGNPAYRSGTPALHGRSSGIAVPGGDHESFGVAYVGSSARTLTPNPCGRETPRQDGRNTTAP